jgi:sulfane dehydrogenase subunit SoxC
MGIPLLCIHHNGIPDIDPSQHELLLHGYEGNANVKWLRRMEVSDQPSQWKDEQSLYAEFASDGKLRQFTMTMEVKSLITRPSGGHQLP